MMVEITDQHGVVKKIKWQDLEWLNYRILGHKSETIFVRLISDKMEVGGGELR